MARERRTMLCSPRSGEVSQLNHDLFPDAIRSGGRRLHGSDTAVTHVVSGIHWRCCMNTLWVWGRASWAGCGPDVRRGGQTLIMGYSADKSPLIGHLAGPIRRLEPLGAQRQEKCGPNRPTPTGYSCNNALELREAELEGIEVRAVGWQVPEGGPGGLEGPLDAGDLVGPEVVGDDDVAGVQGRHQDLVDVGAEALAIDRAVEDPRCGQPRDPQRGEKRAGLPAPAGGVVVDARAARCPTVPPKQIVGAAGFVQKHEVGDVPGRRRRVPRDPRGRDVRPIVFGRADRVV